MHVLKTLIELKNVIYADFAFDIIWFIICQLFFKREKKYFPLAPSLIFEACSKHSIGLGPQNLVSHKSKQHLSMLSAQ
jgi:hypothetical protein